jgi:hypothetical protein
VPIPCSLAPKYLQFIIDHYDHLPDHTLVGAVQVECSRPIA